MSRIFREPGNRPAAISSLDAMLYRGLDTSYFSKWTGLWIPPHKYMDYHAYRINGDWLSPGNLERAEYSDQLVHVFDLESLEAREVVTMPDEMAGMRSRLELRNTSEDPTAVRIGLEVGVDIREKSSDIGPESYSVEKDSSVRVSSGDRFLEIDPDSAFESPGAPRIKEHSPGGDEQRCMVPGEIAFRNELGPGETLEVEVDFSTDAETSRNPLENVESFVDGYMENGYGAAEQSLRNLTYDRKGTGLIAGHPWFQSYWARDCFWTLLGAIDAGHLEIAERTLTNFARRGVPGKIGLNGQEENFPRADTEPLFIVAADHLSRHRSLPGEVKSAMEEAMESLELEDGIVQHDPEGTWMDTLERSPAVDIQSLWLEAARRTGDSRKEKLADGLERFLTEGYLRDHLGKNPSRTVNAAVPLMFGQLDPDDAEEVLQGLNAEFSSLYGARTRSVTDPGYRSSGYHSGSVWGLTTGWAAAANLEYGNSRAGMNFLERLARSGDMFQPGGFPEVLDAESGKLLGCTEQAWSAGMLIHVLDSYLLGIDVEDGEPEFDPLPEVSCLRRKRVGDRYLDIEFKNGETEIQDEEEIC